ncbi:hypothetical protein L6164_015005 [Bauhinia variegata]|uniref:Uncharacterized protein n=1 Tax=Bauhinia variegata TaxID=167791 RepID=A0ACB9NKB2_BAUVA|nr:hypothetical protein L6164_015005 [Bauhinia variegata]
MGSFNSDLLRKAKKLESEGLAKIEFTLASVSGLDRLLLDAYAIRCPKPMDYYNRRDLVRIFNLMAKEIYGNTQSCPVVEGYGSFVMNMFSSESDLDLSINFSSHSTEVPRQKKIETLQKFAKKLYSMQRRGHVTDVQTIMTARVPIVKLIDCGTGIECDLSVDNRDGIAKSYIIHSISSIDDRFQKLSFLMKSWAKANNINSSKHRTLNSLSIVSLVAFHLQTCNPPILPPFSVLLKGGADPTSVTKIINSYLNYGKKNKQSLAELFITLFVKLDSVEKLWQEGLCASLYQGSWIFKSWDFQSYPISIEDFTDRSQNVARAVGREEVQDILRCIRGSRHSILAFLHGHIQASQLMQILFGRRTGSTSGIGINDLPILQNPHPPKKMRLTEEPSVMWGGMQQHHVLASLNPSVPHQPLAIPGTVPSAFPQRPHIGSQQTSWLISSNSNESQILNLPR